LVENGGIGAARFACQHPTRLRRGFFLVFHLVALCCSEPSGAGVPCPSAKRSAPFAGGHKKVLAENKEMIDIGGDFTDREDTAERPHWGRRPLNMQSGRGNEISRLKKGEGQ
jgi:hypothetical protein